MRWQVSLVFAFMGYAGQPACSSCFILSAAENQITWNKALTVSHCCTSEHTWPWERSACCWAAACGQAPPRAEAQIHPPEVTVPCKMSEGTSLKATSSGSSRSPDAVTFFPQGASPHARGCTRSAEHHAAPRGCPTPLGLPVRGSPNRCSAAAMAGVCRERGRVSAVAACNR